MGVGLSSRPGHISAMGQNQALPRRGDKILRFEAGGIRLTGHSNPRYRQRRLKHDHPERVTSHPAGLAREAHTHRLSRNPAMAQQGIDGRLAAAKFHKKLHGLTGPTLLQYRTQEA